jgi:hypothetical protein
MILQLLTELNTMPEDQVVGDDVTKFKDVGSGEQVKGILGIQGRKLYSAMRRQQELISTQATEAGKGKEIPEMLAAIKEIELNSRRHDLLKEIFWQEIKEEFSLDGQGIGIRKDWQVVILPEEAEDDPILEILNTFAMSHGGIAIPVYGGSLAGMGFGNSVESLLLGLRGRKGKCGDPKCKACYPPK